MIELEPMRKASAAIGRQRVRIGAPHAVPAVDCAPDPCAEYGDEHGRVHAGHIVRDAAPRYFTAGQSHGLSVPDVIGAFYSRYFALVNLLGMLLQLFTVSRIIRYLGVPAAVMIPAALSFGVYGALGLFPSLWVVLGGKVAENRTNYSLTNTVRNVLFLPCTREEKYSAKQAIDSFFVRVGDVVTAGWCS